MDPRAGGGITAPEALRHLGSQQGPAPQSLTLEGFVSTPLLLLLLQQRYIM